MVNFFSKIVLQITGTKCNNNWDKSQKDDNLAMDSKGSYVLVSLNRVQQHEESLFKKPKIYLAILKCTKRLKWWIWQIFVINMEKGDNQGNVAKMAYNVKIHQGLVNMGCEEGPLRRWKISRKWRTQQQWVGVPMVHVKAAQHTFFSCCFGFWLIWAAISDISYKQEKENRKQNVNKWIMDH